jgi:RimJ/RimL family protein N-acetyltransferase
MTFRTRHLVIDPVMPADLADIHSISVLDENWLEWIYRGTSVSPNDVGARLYQPNVLTQVVARSPKSGQIGAHLLAYEAHRLHAKVAIVAKPAWHRTGLPAEAFAFFMDYLFYNWPFRKLYVEMLSPQWQRQRSLQRFFEVEGWLSEHEFYAGRYVDLVIAACTRERFDLEATRLRHLWASTSFSPNLGIRETLQT